MTDITSTILHGRLVRDVEVTDIGETHLAKMSIACSHDRKVDGEWTEEVSFFELEMWGNRGKGLQPYLTKGSSIMVQCLPRQDRWVDKETKKNRTKVKFVVNNIQLGRSTATDRKSAAEGQPELDGAEDAPIF